MKKLAVICQFFLAESKNRMKALLAVDNSVHSNHAVQEVIRSPWEPGSELIVVTVVTSPFGFKLPTEIPDSARAFVNGISNQIKTENSSFTSVEGKVTLGNPKSVILTMAKALGVELLIIGARRADFSKMVFGGVSHPLLLASECSVRIARAKKSHSHLRVLIALDASESARMAIEQVLSRPWPAKTEFICLNVVPTFTDLNSRTPIMFADEEVERERAELLKVGTAELESATKILHDNLPQCTARNEILYGDPRECLIRASQDYDADLIVLGSQGRNFSAQVAVGSVSESVALWADCSVEIVRRTAR
ncbi:MAG: universal stress protein [Candidatus Obscuribacterales bacterium]|jgi:nucleotide-binding universal stress UspA family protein|nr:universal stress protein [Candidatus Obscuribacterales bacterium]